jgi:hypothetical protein
LKPDGNPLTGMKPSFATVTVALHSIPKRTASHATVRLFKRGGNTCMKKNANTHIAHANTKPPCVLQSRRSTIRTNNANHFSSRIASGFRGGYGETKLIIGLAF